MVRTFIHYFIRSFTYSNNNKEYYNKKQIQSDKTIYLYPYTILLEIYIYIQIYICISTNYVHNVCTIYINTYCISYPISCSIYIMFYSILSTATLYICMHNYTYTRIWHINEIYKTHIKFTIYSRYIHMGK